MPDFPHVRRTLLTSRSFAVALAIAIGSVTSLQADPAPAPTQADLDFFESKIRPLLIDRCLDCHGPETQEASLRLDQYATMLTGGTSGPAVVPGKPDKSLLMLAISYRDEHLQMPPDEKMPADEIQLLRTWIEKGAPHPEYDPSAAPAPRKGAIRLEEGRQHWAFQPIRRPALPQIDNVTEAANSIDRFILARLRDQDLTPVPPASKRTLIRRATFDLTGLPPTPEEVNAFLADESPQAFERVVDRLLSSPQYGERWGRHWLDVVRYADTNGQDENQGFVDAWRYRNYVINAFNADKPFDEFLMEQVAGDLLDGEPHSSETSDWKSRIIATGFLTLGPKVLAEKDIVKMEMDIIDEQISTFGQAFLGLTLGCARCHDHKFDPVSTADYYALAGIFKSTRTMQSLKTIAQYNERLIATDAEIQRKAELEKQRDQKKQELDALVQSANQALLNEMGADASAMPPTDAENKYPEETRQKLAQLRNELKELEAAIPELPTAMAVEEGTPTDVQIHVRGSHLTLGRTVPRGVPEILLSSGPLKIGEGESGRLQLARWLVSSDNPLTARVLVNRIWRWHFGQGLVPTTDNFGLLGEAPSHPELLDWLASEFIDRGWSVKALHKQIMLSQAYQRSSTPTPQLASGDPENRYLGRANLQRLDAEQIRDSMLAVSGLIDLSPGQKTIQTPKWQLVFDHTSRDATTYRSFRRSVYLPVIRNNLYDGFALFDYTNADVPSGDRATSTIAPQALYMMNSDAVLSAAEALAERILQERPDDKEACAMRLYEICLGRPVESHEAHRLLRFVELIEEQLLEEESSDNPHLAAWTAVCQSVLCSNEFIYVE